MLSPQLDESWVQLIAAADLIGMPRNTHRAEEYALWRYVWCPLDGDQRRAAIERLTLENYPDGRFVPQLENYLRKSMWMVTLRRKSDPGKVEDEATRRARQRYEASV